MAEADEASEHDLVGRRRSRDTHDWWCGRGQETIYGTTLTSACSTNLDSVVCKCASVLSNDGGLEQSARANGGWCSDVNLCLLWQGWTREARRRINDAKCSNRGKTGHLRAMCRQREKSAGKSSPLSSSGKSSGKSGTSPGHADKCNCCGQVGHRRPDCPRRNERCSLCGKRGHLSQVCRSPGGNANALAVDVDPAEPEEEREIQHVWALSVHDTSGLPLDALSVCDNSDLPSDELGNLLNMIIDSGAEEHVVSLADWRSLGEPVLKTAQVRLRSATGDDMGVSGILVVRGWCDNQVAELTAVVLRLELRGLCVQQRNW